MELKDLKVGDKVFVGDFRYKTLLTVEKVTPKGFIKVNGSLYDPKTGRKRGGNGSWYRSMLSVATPEAIEEYNKKKFVEKVLYKLDGVKELTYEQAVEISKILWGDSE